MDDLPNRACRVHDRRPHRVGCERREGLQRTASRGRFGKRQDIRLLRFEARRRCLEYLDQTLVKQRSRRDGLARLPIRDERKSEMGDLPCNAERRQIFDSRAVRNRIGYIGDRLRRLPRSERWR